MPDHRFYKKPDAIALGKLVEMLELSWVGDAKPDIQITDIAPLDHAGDGDLTFLAKQQFVDSAPHCNATACITTTKYIDHFSGANAVLLTTEKPDVAFGRVTKLFYPSTDDRPAGRKKFSSDGLIDKTAKIEEGVTIEPGAVIMEGCEIGAGTFIASNAVLRPNVSVGRECAIHSNCVVQFAYIGDRVHIHPNCTIGGEGFGYSPSPKGHAKIPQLGRIIIQNDVEIGSNVAIDRGALGDTVIGEGTKIDNLVHIAHNVFIGRHCLIAGQTGFSGSVDLGDFTMIGGQVGFVDNIRIGPGAQFAARSGAMTNLEGGQVYGGMPAKPLREYKRELVTLSRLAKRGKKT